MLKVFLDNIACTLRTIMPTAIQHSTVELPTYETGPENPNPWFGKRLGAHPYPYRIQNRLTGTRTIKAHDAVILENEYLRLTFPPDFGCRLFSAYDKMLRREVFYRNDCIKPALIAIRGAWISGGIEFNFPVSHSVYTHSRIPHTTRMNEDGSASMVFGLTEQMTGMRFTVEVTLTPGEYRFSEHVRLYNGTPLPHRHYWWTNAATQLTPQTQMIYPLHSGISGRYGDGHSWPLHEGVDLSWARNHASAGDVFGRETYDDFFGVYHHDLGYGVAHWARQEELPARKMFFWGADEMGRLWQRQLTENAGDYLEIQAGRFATQSDFDLLMPHKQVEFTEYWIPVGKTDGYVKAHPEGIINVVPDGPDSKVAVQLTSSHQHIRLLMSRGPHKVAEFAQAFEAGRVYWFDVPAWTEDASVRVFGTDGLLFLYDPGIRERRCDTVPRTCVMPKQTETPDEILQSARIRERMDSPASALEQYERLIGTERDPEARKGLARFALRAGSLAEAEKHARLAGSDPEATYLLAQAIGGTDEAMRLHRSLVDDPVFGTASRRHLAETALKRGEYTEGAACTDDDPLLHLIAALSARKAGDMDAARSRLNGLLSADPLWRHAQWEMLFLDPDAAVEMLPEAFQEDMDAAAWYHGLGLHDETRTIIEAWAEAGPPADPFFDALADELRVQVRHRADDQRGVVNCFAHRDEFTRILEKRHDPESAVMLGNILYANGRTDEAIASWDKARSAGITDYIPYRNLALAHWHQMDDLKAAYRLMREAHDMCPTDADTLRDLDILAERSGAYDDRRGIADRILRYAQEDSSCLERAIRVLLEAGRHDEAVALLTTKRFFVAELAYQTRILYVRALLERGARLYSEGDYEKAASDFLRATEYPENLGASRFQDSSDAQAHYLLGLALNKLGRTTEVREAWDRAANDIPVMGAEQAFYVGMARRNLGMPNADEAFAKLVPPDAGDSPQEQARRNYILGLEHLTKGDHGSAQRHFTEAQRAESADPVKMHNHLESVCYTTSEGRRVPTPVWWTVEPQHLT